MEKVDVDTTSVSTAAIHTTSREFDKHFTFLNRNQVVNSQTEQEKKSLNTIQNMVEGKGNTVFEFEANEDDLLNYHDDVLPIITSVFSLAKNTAEIKQENLSNIEFVDSQFPLPPVTETVIQNQFDYSGVAQLSPGLLPFVVKCEPGGLITVSSPTRTILGKVEEKNRNMKFDTEKSYTDCYKIPCSTTHVSDSYLPTNQHNLPVYIYNTGKGLGHLMEPESNAFDNKSEDNGNTFDNVPSYKENFKNPFQYNNFTAQLNGDAIRDTPEKAEMYNNDNKTGQAILTTEEKIDRLKNLLRRKEEKLEKIRFQSKKKTLSATIDKLKLNLLKRNNVCHHSSVHQNMETEEQSSNATTLNQILYSGEISVNLVQDGNVKKETDTAATENVKYQRYETDPRVHLTRISTSVSSEQGEKYKVDDKGGLEITKPRQYLLEENVAEKRKNELEVNDISNVLFQGEKQSCFPKRLKGGPKVTNNKFKTLADLLA